ncbi:hypothetical protein FRC02_002644 [Tulasnella sp. 418]|nr:hypothetical protein FRC02_002644 [Tulasnella sp. 418]
MPTHHSRKVRIVGARKDVRAMGTTATRNKITTGEILFAAAHASNTVSLAGAAVFGTMDVIRTASSYDRGMFVRAFATGTFFLSGSGIILGICIKQTASRKAGRLYVARALKSRQALVIYGLMTVLALLSLIITAWLNC